MDDVFGVKEFEIIVNGVKEKTPSEFLTYDNLCFSNGRTCKVGTVFTITYSDGPECNPEGSVVPNQTVHIQDGMNFNIGVTDNA